MKRRLLVLALLPAMLEPLALFAKARAAEKHECRDHVCMCARRCPPKRGREEPCHESANQGPALRGACNHDQTATLASAAPAILPAVAGLAIVPPAAVSNAPFVAEGHPSGFTQLDPPPPRTL